MLRWTQLHFVAGLRARYQPGSVPVARVVSDISVAYFVKPELATTRSVTRASVCASFHVDCVLALMCVHTGTGVAPPYERAAQAALEVLTQAEERARGALSRTLRVSSLMASGAFSH